jgi:hypothetical protein
MNITKIETFKEWLISKNLRLTNQPPKKRNEFSIKILLERTNQNKPKIKNKRNEKI